MIGKQRGSSQPDHLYRLNPVEEDAKAAVAMHSQPSDRLHEVERLRIGRSNDPLKPATQVLHPSAGQPPRAGRHGPELLHRPPFRVRRRLPPRCEPRAPAVAVHQPLGRLEESASASGPLSLALQHDPAGGGDVRAREAGRQVEDEDRRRHRGLHGRRVLVKEEADAAVAGGGEEERAADDGGGGGRRRGEAQRSVARLERGGEEAPADAGPPRRPRDMAAAGRGLLFFSAAVFADGHDSRRHVCMPIWQPLPCGSFWLLRGSDGGGGRLAASSSWTPVKTMLADDLPRLRLDWKERPLHEARGAKVATGARGARGSGRASTTGRKRSQDKENQEEFQSTQGAPGYEE
ncbi:uncharacterized protein LOC124697338 [Lolium rigidum]|uniref:uncharacterized protein LOC124697338 n=1 Tax=Lolium rigidum TaxID=89674 RepID=UPI001F5D351A|nr:uncharacterized protein LOC124697338 [Lolium rigidum]